MKELIGSPGTVSGLVLRIGQCSFAATSIGIMVSANAFSDYTAFCYLIASMGLQLLWSFGLACLDVYALRRKRDLQNPVLVSLFVVGDWVTALLSLAAACSSAGVVVLYARDLKFCKVQTNLPCNRYEISILMAFLTWLLIGVSSHVMLWILASV
ncbi:hypothetical protein K2173_019634 [Erythroxylum novogranatense]|uniref:CASP-like protein n=1 Tax=Erythroxylum novogranatense TaxID=1862640 RepID=A0AAV8UBS9_9ROSI|nr:hypothetical protein K2173_019634 [Erythroxylum novogranatense]